jgi:CMP-N,N'-diacetyllegionaminic acid synthase
VRSGIITGLIPARHGSLRVPDKNIRRLNNHPLLSYSILSAQNSGIFSRIVVATDSEQYGEIASYYGADSVFFRDPKNCTATSLDYEWLSECYRSGVIRSDYFAILRPTSPFRSANLIRNVVDKFFALDTDSIRTVTKVSEHPGKMWRVSQAEKTMIPFTAQLKDQVATHAMQYQSLETLYIQTSVLELAKTEVLEKFKNREGRTISPYVTDGFDNIAIDTELDWQFVQMLSKEMPSLLPKISKSPFSESK